MGLSQFKCIIVSHCGWAQMKYFLILNANTLEVASSLPDVSVTRRSRSDVGYWVTHSLTHWALMTTWWLIGDHLVTTWWLLGDYLVTTWWPLGDHLVTTWWPLGDYLETTWWQQLGHIVNNGQQSAVLHASVMPLLAPYLTPLPTHH